MNGFIPTLLGVLLAEIGERALALTNTSKRDRLAMFAVALIVLAAIGGTIVTTELTPDSATLLIGIALALAAFNQWRAPRPQAVFWSQVATFWGGGSLLVIFAMAARFGGIAAASGGLAGLFAAIVLSRVALADGWKVAALRWASAVLLLVAALVAVVSGLRLI